MDTYVKEEQPFPLNPLTLKGRKMETVSCNYCLYATGNKFNKTSELCAFDGHCYKKPYFSHYKQFKLNIPISIRKCPECKSKTKIFSFLNKKQYYNSVMCSKCGYTDIVKTYEI